MIKFIWQIIKEVARLFLLLLTLLASVVFQLTRELDASAFKYPDEDEYSHVYFPFSKVELYRDTYFHYLLIYGIWFVLSLYIWLSSTRHRIALFIFSLIHFIALIDYLLNYNEIWFYVSQYPISWNILKAVIFTLAIINEIFLILERRWINS